MHTPSQHWRTITCALLLALLGACASQPAPMGSPNKQKAPAAPAPSDWQQYQRVLGSIKQWQVQGKLGIRLPDNSGSAYFNWKQDADHYAIHLNGPLGQGATWIRGDSQQVSLERAGQSRISAATPEELMASSMGWWLPVSQLFYWVRGIPAPDSSIEQLQRFENGSLKSFSQNGWQIDYPRYREVDGWPLPGKLIAAKDGIKLTFIIKNWRLH